MRISPATSRIIVVTTRPPVDGLVRATTADVALVRRVHGPTALPALVKSWQPHVIVCDVTAAAPDGVGKVRELSIALPLIALTSRADAAAVVSALEAGADDVVALPVERAELRARIRALLRRHAAVDGDRKLSFGPFTIDTDARTAQFDGRDLEVTPLEFALLHLLVAARGEVVTKDRILAMLWGARAPDSNVVAQQVRRLRKKLGDSTHRRWIATRGPGYVVLGRPSRASGEQNRPEVRSLARWRTTIADGSSAAHLALLEHSDDAY